MSKNLDLASLAIWYMIVITPGNIYELEIPFTAITMANNLGEGSTLVDDKQKQKEWLCDDCGTNFTARRNLLSHKAEVHGEIKPYKCHLCKVLLRFRLCIHIRQLSRFDF